MLAFRQSTQLYLPREHYMREEMLMALCYSPSSNTKTQGKWTALLSAHLVSHVSLYGTSMSMD